MGNIECRGCFFGKVKRNRIIWCFSSASQHIYVAVFWEEVVWGFFSCSIYSYRINVLNSHFILPSTDPLNWWLSPSSCNELYHTYTVNSFLTLNLMLFHNWSFLLKQLLLVLLYMDIFCFLFYLKYTHVIPILIFMKWLLFKDTFGDWPGQHLLREGSARTDCAGWCPSE